MDRTPLDGSPPGLPAATGGRRPRGTARPRDRRDQLVSIAAELFRRRGYHNVGVNDIAAAAGITGPALYRHFPGKQAILGHVVLAGLDQFTAAVGAAVDVSAGEPPEVRLTVLAGAAARLVVERRELGAMWRREGRNLPRTDRAELAARARAATRSAVRLLQRVRPELPDADADLLCWAAMSVFGSVSDHHVTLPRASFERSLAALALAVVRCDVVPWPVPSDPTGSSDGSPGGRDGSGDGAVPRREQLLALAARMFREHGFHGVTMEDIGAAAGISGPSIYRHYTGKADLLLAMCGRIGERLHSGADSVLGAGLDPPAALRALAASFVDAVLDNRDLVAAYLTEGDSLPARDRTDLRRRQRRYVDCWVRLLTASDPDVDDRTARVRVHAAFAVVNDLARTARFARRPRLAAELTELVGVVLLPP